MINNWNNRYEEVDAWVDGSYNHDFNLSGSGVIFLNEDTPILELAFSEVSLNSDNNITGEINGALKAIEESFYRGVKTLNIYHDLQHLGAWYRGEFKANNPSAKIFVKKAKLISSKSNMKINFIKVKGHSKLSLNDRADYLARKGCGKT